MNDRQARAAQSKLNVTSSKTVHYCIPAAQLDVREVTRPSFSRRLKGVASETTAHPVLSCADSTVYVLNLRTCGKGCHIKSKQHNCASMAILMCVYVYVCAVHDAVHYPVPCMLQRVYMVFFLFLQHCIFTGTQLLDE